MLDLLKNDAAPRMIAKLQEDLKHIHAKCISVSLVIIKIAHGTNSILALIRDVQCVQASKRSAIVAVLLGVDLGNWQLYAMPFARVRDSCFPLLIKTSVFLVYRWALFQQPDLE